MLFWSNFKRAITLLLYYMCFGRTIAKRCLIILKLSGFQIGVYYFNNIRGIIDNGVLTVVTTKKIT